MKLLFKQRFFSWLDSYDIYDENDMTVFTVKGELSLGHRLNIFDRNGQHVGTVKEKLLTFLPRFELESGGRYLGSLCKELTFLKPRYVLDFNGWTVQGSFTEWDYAIYGGGREIAVITKQLWNWTDTYVIDVADSRDTLCALMVVLAIDAEKCSRDS